MKRLKHLKKLCAVFIMISLVFGEFMPFYYAHAEEVSAPEEIATEEQNPAILPPAAPLEPATAEEPALVPTETDSAAETEESSLPQTETTPMEPSSEVSENQESSSSPAESSPAIPISPAMPAESAEPLHEVLDAIEQVPIDEQAPVIVSGDSAALVNILNLVNTKFINSEGTITFKNLIDKATDNIDLRTEPGSQKTCTDPCTTGDEVSVQSDDDADIENDIKVSANTGDNKIDNSNQGKIKTGNAYAAANVVNVANTDVIDSKYLVVTLNAFEGIESDIVFPSLFTFMSSLGNDSANIGTVTAKKEAEVENDIESEATTGENELEGSGSITTGSSSSTVNVHNQANTTLIGGQSVSIVFKVKGDWQGEIFGLPEGFAYKRDDNGNLYIYSQETAQDVPTIPANTVSVETENETEIENEIDISANTGRNEIDDAEQGVIETGNAKTAVNVVNVANTTVIGYNWIIALINIFGDFIGNIAFGRPDLWIGEIIDAPEHILNGDVLTYNFTIKNNGDSISTNTVVTEDFDERYMEIISSPLEFVEAEGKLIWNIGSLNPGQTISVSYTAKVKDAPDGTDITNTVSVFGREKDNNADDNTETVTVRTHRASTGGGGGGNGGTGGNNNQPPQTGGNTGTLPSPQPAISIIRKNTDTTAKARDIVHQEILVRNSGNADMPGVTFIDMLYGPNGEVIQRETFNLDTVYAGEEIEIAYDISFGANAAAGTYNLGAFIQSASGILGPLAPGKITLLAPEPVLTVQESIASTAIVDTLPIRAENPVSKVSRRPSTTAPSTNSNEFIGGIGGADEELYFDDNGIIEKITPSLHAAAGSGIDRDSYRGAFIPWALLLLTSIIYLIALWRQKKKQV